MATALQRSSEQTLRQVVAELEGAAVERHEVPESVAAAAAAATRRVLAGEQIGVRRRAEAYFSACVARGLMRRAQPSRAADRLVLASVVADLSASGRDGAAIWDELVRGWRGAVPPEVLDEFRARLCA